MSWFRLGSLLMALSIAMGSFGAHYLKPRLDPALLEVYRIGVLYQMFHALALIVVAWRISTGIPRASTAGMVFIAGIALFSGSLYLVSLAQMRWAGAITPLGGLCFITGWLLLAFS